jgi:hypothetical protein
MKMQKIKIKLLFSLFIVMALFFPSTLMISAATPENLFKNPGFEEITATELSIPYKPMDNWAGFISAQSCQPGLPEGFSVTTEDKKSGSKSLKIDGATDYTGVYQDIVVKPNTYYIWAMKAKLLSGKMQLAIVCGETVGAEEEGQLYAALKKTGSDFSFNAPFDIPASPNNGWLSPRNGNLGNNIIYTGEKKILRFIIQPANNAKAYVDDLTLYECNANGIVAGLSSSSTISSTVNSESLQKIPSENASVSSVSQASSTAESASSALSASSSSKAQSVNAANNTNEDKGIPGWVIFVVVSVIILEAGGVCAFILLKKKPQ